MKKKILASILAFCMLFSLAIPAMASFDDTESHWGKDAIDRWAAVGVLNGKGDGVFDPNGSMTRAEFAQMLCNMMGYTKKAANTFSDIPDDAWYADAMLKLVEAGVINGVGNNMAAPNAPITREQAAVMLCRAFNIKTSNASLSFADSSSVSSWARDSVAALAELGMMNGVGNNNVAPQLNINRASVATLIDNMVAEYVTEDKTITGEVNGIVIVAPGATVTFEDAEVTLPVIVADNASVDVGKNASVDTIDVIGANATISGEGSVANVTVAPDADNTKVTTKDTVVENNSDTPVTTASGSIAAGETANTTEKKEEPKPSTSGGGSSGGPSGPSSSTTDPEPKKDENIKGLSPVDPDGEIEEMPTVTAKVLNNTITLTADGLVPMHKNRTESATKGAWVGVAIKPAEGATGFKYAFGETIDTNAVVMDFEGIGDNIESGADFNSGATFWFNAATKTESKVTLQWVKAENEGKDVTNVGTATTYTVDLSGVKVGYNLTVKAGAESGVSTNALSNLKVGSDELTLTNNAATALVETGESVTVTVESTKDIAVCLMYEGNNDAPDVRRAGSLAADGKFTFTITFTMPAKDATLLVGVLNACETDYTQTPGLSACEANNSTAEGSFFNSLTSVSGEPGPSGTGTVTGGSGGGAGGSAD